MYCESCGSLLVEGQKFCQSCGAAVPDESVVQNVAAQPVEAQPVAQFAQPVAAQTNYSVQPVAQPSYGAQPVAAQPVAQPVQSAVPVQPEPVSPYSQPLQQNQDYQTGMPVKVEPVIQPIDPSSVLPKNVCGMIGFILGIVSVCISYLGPGGARTIAIAGVVLSIIGLIRRSKTKWQSIAGLCLSASGIILAIIFAVIESN